MSRVKLREGNGSVNRSSSVISGSHASVHTYNETPRATQDQSLKIGVFSTSQD